MNEIIEMFSSLLGDVDLSQITEIFTALIAYITNLLSSLM